MGPKYKSKKKFASESSLAVTGNLCREIKKTTSKIDLLDIELAEKRYSLASKENESKNLTEKIKEFDLALESLRQQHSEYFMEHSWLVNEVKQQKILRKKLLFSDDNRKLGQFTNLKNTQFFVSRPKALKRKCSPSSSELNLRSKIRRCNETYDACSFISGGCQNNKHPILINMLQTICRKFKATDVVNELLNSKCAITQKLSDNFVNAWHNKFYKSDENVFRSLNIYYSHNVMGKTKYRLIRKANQNSLFQKHRVTNYIPYPQLSAYISLEFGYWPSVRYLS